MRDESLPRRRALRLPRYDYAQPGAYFVTLCVHGRRHLFGDIVDGVVLMTDAGRMIEEWWWKLPGKFPGVAIDGPMVMPNHLHGMIFIGDIGEGNVGATPCGRPMAGRAHGPAPTLGRIIGWFKTMTTNSYIAGANRQIWPRFSDRLWQRNYWEHVVRDDDELARIRQYIANNPANWANDRENPAAPPPAKPGLAWEI